MGKIKKIIFLTITSTFLTSCDASEAVKDVNIVPSWLSLVVQLLALTILIVVVILFAYKPVKKLLKKRSEYIENNIKDSEKNKAIAEQNVIQSKEMIIASKKQASEIVSEASLTAKNNANEIILNAQKEVEKMKKDAEIDIERSKQAAIDAIHDEMVDVALEASKEILKREVTDKDNERLAKEFIEKL